MRAPEKRPGAVNINVNNVISGYYIDLSPWERLKPEQPVIIDAKPNEEQR